MWQPILSIPGELKERRLAQLICLGHDLSNFFFVYMKIAIESKKPENKTLFHYGIIRA